MRVEEFPGARITIRDSFLELLIVLDSRIGGHRSSALLDGLEQSAELGWPTRIWKGGRMHIDEWEGEAVPSTGS